MKKINLIVGMFIFAGISNMQGQGGFQNLDFEAAQLTQPPGQYGGYVSAANAIPGWSVYIGANQSSSVLQNNLTLGAPSIDILGPGFVFPNMIIDGQYTMDLQAGSFSPGTLTDVSIQQTGLVPQNSQTLFVKAWGNFSASFASQNLSFSAVGSGQNYVLYAANISQFAGQTGTLIFSSIAGGQVGLDDITFSPLATVPEPETYALCLFGVLGLWLYRRQFRATA